MKVGRFGGLELALATVVAHSTALPPTRGDANLSEADSAYFDGRPGASLAICEDAISRGDETSQLRWRAARAAIAVGMVRPHGPEQFMLYDRAIGHARRAVELSPGSDSTRYWLGASLGIRAQEDDPIYSARLALEAYEIATSILARDSTHAGAHHLLGMLHASVVRVPALVRFVAGRMLRIDVVRKASAWEAERHLRRAVELAPTMLLYVSDLALYYESTHRHDAALEVVRLMDATPSRQPVDEFLRATVHARISVRSVALSRSR